MHRESNASFFSHFNEPVKLVHIDASHDYESVKADIEAALKLLVRGVVICGHDADTPGVRLSIGEVREGFERVESGNGGANTGMWRWMKPVLL